MLKWECLVGVLGDGWEEGLETSMGWSSLQITAGWSTAGKEGKWTDKGRSPGAEPGAIPAPAEKSSQLWFVPFSLRQCRMKCACVCAAVWVVCHLSSVMFRLRSRHEGQIPCDLFLSTSSLRLSFPILRWEWVIKMPIAEVWGLSDCSVLMMGCVSPFITVKFSQVTPTCERRGGAVTAHPV